MGRPILQCCIELAAGEKPITSPAARFAPRAAARGVPVVAPVIKTASRSAMNRPTAKAFSRISGSVIEEDPMTPIASFMGKS